MSGSLSTPKLEAVKPAPRGGRDKFLEKYNFPKLNQEEIENLKAGRLWLDIHLELGFSQSPKVLCILGIVVLEQEGWVCS